jgi:hypothetical protein
VNWIELASALGAFVGSFLAYYKGRSNSAKIDSVDKKVNGNLTSVMTKLDTSHARITQLATAITEAGNTVPEEKRMA